MPGEGVPVTVAFSIGKLDEFDSANESLSDYVERAQLFFEANGIAGNKQVAGFLSAIGGKTYALLRNLVAPTPPKDKTFDELVAVLKAHFEPKPLIIAERFAFHRRQQAKGETVADYVAELRKLTKHCEFGAYLEEALRDRFVCGLRSEPTQYWLKQISLFKEQLGKHKEWRWLQCKPVSCKPLAVVYNHKRSDT